jgi:hypothetical protein
MNDENYKSHTKSFPNVFETARKIEPGAVWQKYPGLLQPESPARTGLGSEKHKITIINTFEHRGRLLNGILNKGKTAAYRGYDVYQLPK